MREPAIRRRIEFRHPPQERHHGPHFVIALLHGPGRHAGELDAVLDDREELLWRPPGESPRQLGRRRCHCRHDWWQPAARPAMARETTAFVMACSSEDECLIVEWRRLN